jgi:hypothetical protein
LNRERLQGFRQMHLKGSRLCDAALFFASLVAVAASVLLSPLAIAFCALALLLSAAVRLRAARLCGLASEDGETLTCARTVGQVVRGQPRAARMGRAWISVALEGECRPRYLLLFADQFDSVDDYRRFRLWLRAVLQADASDADEGWSGWLRRWYRGSHD